MIIQYKKSISIENCNYAISNVGIGWEKNWENILRGTKSFHKGEDFIKDWPESPPLAIMDIVLDKKDKQYETRMNHSISLATKFLKPRIDEIFKKSPDIKLFILVATSQSDPDPLSKLVDIYSTENAIDIPPEVCENILTNKILDKINTGLERELQGTIISGACASSLVAVSYACDLIDFGTYDAVLIVAVDTLSRLATVAFNNIGAMSEKGCSPYSVKRDGTTVGEGLGTLLLVREELAINPTNTFVTGTAVYCDAAHLVEPNPNGVALTINNALLQSNLNSEQIRAIYFHGTGTIQNDKTESATAKLIFSSKSPPCTSTKSVIGHTMGASGAFNILAGIETFNSGLLPHVALSSDNEFDNLDVVLNEPRQIKTKGPILITALGFGGINSAILIKNK